MYKPSKQRSTLLVLPSSFPITALVKLGQPTQTYKFLHAPPLDKPIPYPTINPHVCVYIYRYVYIFVPKTISHMYVKSHYYCKLPYSIDHMSGGRVLGDDGVGREAPMKVVIIDTRYVETDAVSFKSVVQKLTGKDSTAAEDNDDERRAVANRSTPTMKSAVVKDGRGRRQAATFLTRDISFKDFDTLLKDMPSIDDLMRC